MEVMPNSFPYITLPTGKLPNTYFNFVHPLYVT